MTRIDVIGIVENSPLTFEAENAIINCDLLLGSKRLLRVVNLPKNIEIITLTANTIGILKEFPKDKNIVILGSNDPLYNGIGSSLKKYGTCDDVELKFHASVTAFQLLFAKIGESWESAKLFSLHGKNTIPYYKILSSKLAVIYGDSTNSAKVMAEKFIQYAPNMAKRLCAVGCNLNLEDEYIKRATLEEIANDENADRSLSILILFPCESSMNLSLPLGLSDDNYIHYKNMITHPEIRAIVVSKLSCSSGVMWDLGAASGSVGIEVALLNEKMEVYSVEKNPERFLHLKANVEREGLDNVKIFNGDLKDIAPTLPKADRIFIGGGSRNMLEWAMEELNPNGILVVTSVTPETSAQLFTSLKEYNKELLTMQVSRVNHGIFNGENPITIAVFRKEENL